MTQDPTKPKIVKPKAQESPPQATSDPLASFLPLLIALRSPRTHLTAAPDFIPKTFEESIQYYDDEAGTPERRLYLFINGDWRYITLT